MWPVLWDGLWGGGVGSRGTTWGWGKAEWPQGNTTERQGSCFGSCNLMLGLNVHWSWVCICHSVLGAQTQCTQRADVLVGERNQTTKLIITVNRECSEVKWLETASLEQGRPLKEPPHRGKGESTPGRWTVVKDPETGKMMSCLKRASLSPELRQQRVDR